MTADVIGWASSAVLLVTLGDQTAKVYRSDSARGVSRWLYVGQLLASAGFTIYSALVHNIVFTVTNALGLLTAIVGLVLVWRKKRREHGRSGAKARWPRVVNARPFSRVPPIS